MKNLSIVDKSAFFQVIGKLSVPKTRKRVLHIPDEYDILCENIAQSCQTSWIVKYVQSFHSDSLFVAKPDLGENLTKKLSEVDISAIFGIGQIININLTLT